MEICDDGVMNIMDAVIRNCMNQDNKTAEEKSTTKNFVNNSEIFKLWCIVKDFDESVVRNKIILGSKRVK